MPPKFKPMLAAKLVEKDLGKLVYPMMVSPKLDGIRCVITSKGAMSRNLKPIRNIGLRGWLNKLPVGFDGELVIPGAPFSEISSAVMSEDAPHKSIEYWVFDTCKTPAAAFIDRYEDLCLVVKKMGCDWVKLVPQIECHSTSKVLELEELWLGEGYEGIILRDPEAMYKYGRSTVTEQYLMKFKRFVDSEAEILEVLPLFRNFNEATKDELGRTKRSSAKGGKIPVKQLGKLHVRDLKTGVEFDIGSGWSEAQRIAWWKVRSQLLRKVVKYKYQMVGTKDAPRFPVFIGIRDKDDM